MSWYKTKIGDQVLLQRAFDITKAEQREGPFPVVSSSGIQSFHEQKMVDGPGVVLGRKGVVGSVYYIRSDYWPHDTTLWVKDFKGNDRHFVYYFFRDMADDLANLDVGSANPTLNRNHVHPIEISWPPLHHQQAIASILGALDDKIELNREMNKTLEAMARALFKSWFVDFDPVVAKAAGRKPFGMDAATAALFPDRFEESELGPIPAGWRVDALDSIANFLNGLALQKYPPHGPNFLPVIKIAQMKSGSVVGADKASQDIPDSYVVKDGDILFSWSGSLEVVVWTSGEGALNQHLFKVTSAHYPKWFFLGWLREHLAEFQDIAAGKATTMGHIQRHHLNQANVVLPCAGVIEPLNPLAEPLLQKSISNDLENRTLAQLRDLLLPKLLSGEIRVRDAEKMVGAAV